MSDRTYSVTTWGSHPDLDEDTCWTGSTAPTLAEARDYLARERATAEACEGYGGGNTSHVMLDGPGVHEVYAVASYHEPGAAQRRAREHARELAAERSERAMQAGMAFGCEGYNDEMGW